MKTIFQRYNNTLRALCSMLLLLSGLAGGRLHAQTAHPDKVYPIPQNYRSVNQGGVNLMTGDLNLDFSLAAISGRSASFDIGLFYNSKSADLPDVGNTVGGQGWKLMDYPKIVQDGSNYYFLDGQRSYALKTDNEGYHTETPYHLWRFRFFKDIVGVDDQWTIQTENGKSYRLSNTSVDRSYTFYHLSQINDLVWDDQLNLSYNANGRLTSVSNASALGDELVCHYNGLGYLKKIENKHNHEVRHQVLLEYNEADWLSDIKGISKLPNGLFTTDDKSLHFNYHSNGRMSEVVSPSGTVRRYKYSSELTDLLGRVIRYSTDNGYPNHTLTGEQPAGEDADATYSAIWYDQSKYRLEDDYPLFNRVRVYPGGFRASTDDYAAVEDPFGYETYYFFTGHTAGSLSDLPDHYANNNVSVDDIALRGMVYLSRQYSEENSAADTPVGSATYLYTLNNFRNIQVPLLEEERKSVDGVNEQSIWYDYYDDYLLPKTTISSRENPTPDDPDKKEYEGIETRYAYQDYSGMELDYLLTPVSRQFSAVATYSDNTPHTDASLEWLVTDASLTRWKAWDVTNGWAPEFSYRLQQDFTGFPTITQIPDPATWLKTDEVLSRNAHGYVTASKDLSGNVASTIYDEANDNIYPVATFYNAGATAGEAGYLGFEEYEATNGWDFSDDGEVTNDDAHTGHQSLHFHNGSTFSTLSLSSVIPQNSGVYVFSAFIKDPYEKTPDDMTVIGITYGGNSSGGNVYHYSSSYSVGEWVYYQMTFDSNSRRSNIKPTIKCTDCYIDDVRFHPIDASFSATVYESDPGGEENMHLPLATLGANGETWQQVYNAVDEPIAVTGPAGQVKALSLQYHSREGIALFGDSDPADAHFDQNHPHSTLQLVPRKGSVVETFRSGNNSQFTALSNMSMEDGLLKLGTISENAEATFSTTVDASDYALHVEAIPSGTSRGWLHFYLNDAIRLTMRMSGDRSLYLQQNSSGWQNLALESIERLPEYLSLTLLVMDGNHLFVYADGRFLFDYTFSGSIAGTVKLRGYQAEGSAFDNFIYLEDPIIGKQTFDAEGNVKQSLVHHEPDELFVTEMLYGDALDLPMAATRGTHITPGADTDQGLAFRDGFADLSYTSNTRGGTLTATGEVKDAHDPNNTGFNTPFVVSQTYENDVFLRPDRAGSGGAFTAGAGYSSDYEYEEGNNEFGFAADELHKQSVSHAFDSNQGDTDVTTETYSGIATGATFASVIEDHEHDGAKRITRKEQAVYDEQMRLNQHLQPNYFDNSNSGFKSQTEYDFLGNVTYTQDPDGGTTQYAYDGQQRLRIRQDQAGLEASTTYLHYWKYDRLGRVTEEGIYEGTPTPAGLRSMAENAAGGRSAVGYLTLNGDDNGYTGHMDLKAGIRVSFEPGFSTDAVAAFGSAVENEVEPRALSANIAADVLGEKWAVDINDPDWPRDDDTNRKVKRTYQYDYDDNDADNMLGRLVNITTYDDPGGSDYNTERYTYDREGRMVRTEQEITEGGTTVTDAFDYTYDALGQLIGMKHDKGASTHTVDYEVQYTYDRMGRVSAIGDATDPDAYARYDYDNDGFTETLGSTGVTVRYETNNEGLPDSIKAEKGGNVLFEEALYYTDRESTTQENDGYYNGLIAGISYKGASYQDYDYHYDGFGQLTLTSNGGVYEYDANGNLTRKEFADNSDDYLDNYDYKGNNRLREFKRNTIQGNQITDYTYDPLGRVITVVKDDGNMLRYSYDSFNSLTEKMAGSGQMISYTYGPHDERIKKTVTGTDARTIRYFRGLNDYPLIEAVTDNGSTAYYTYIYGSTGLLVVDKTNDAAGNSRHYTATMEPENASQEESVFANLQATRVVHPQANHTKGGTYTVELNVAQPVGPTLMLPVSAGDSIRLETRAYTTDQPGDNATLAASMTLADQVAAAFSGSGGVGNEGTQQTYNGINAAAALLTGLHDDDRTAGPKAYLNYLLFDEALHYIDGGFVAATEASENASELLQVNDLFIAQTGYLYTYLSYEGKENRSVYFDDLAVAHTLSADAKYVIKDHLGSTRTLVNTSGAVVARYDYDAFGEEVAHSPSSMEVRYLYTGQEYEKETALYNYRARLYDPVLGRFLTPDPLSQQNSPYAYVGNNPISHTDPTGAWFGIDDLVAIAGGAVIGAGFELVSQALSGDGINWKKVGVAAAAGAAAGETALYAGPVAAGAVNAGLNKLGDNLVDGKRGREAFDGVATAAAIGAATAGVIGVAGKGVSKLASRGVAGKGVKLASRSSSKVAGKGVNKASARLANKGQKRIPCGGCFTKDTPVKTAEGEKAIQTIQTGDQVWAFNEETGEQELRTVSNTFSLMREATYTLKIENEWIETTSDHPFYIDEQWVEAASLSVGDSVLFLNNRKSAIEAIDFAAGYTQVYNFEVEGLHNYFVG